ncbi:MAG TPA: tRNA pseudouridine(55) synthase TruB [Methylomirabilota bacterium]|nr:tRNA pseudouridine(55) synthase TruB [Methylomirabilota bacterium]
MSESRRSGVLSVEKGAGVTSFQVVAHLRRVLRAPRIGHGGTLDPDATGVLPILIGDATKLTPYLIELDKEYVATVRLGITTETQDLSGAVIETRPVPELDAAALEGALGHFVGAIRQIPPMFSALRRGGKRLYELARQGREVEREPREVTVHSIELERLSLPDFVIRVRCGKGTYVRTLAADIGARLGCGAALAALVRTRVGPYTLDEAVPWAELREARSGIALWPRLLPSDSALVGLPPVRLDAERVRQFLHGQTIPVPGAPDAALEGLVRVYGPDGAFLGVGQGRRGAVKPERLLHADPPRSSVLPA